MVQGIKNDSGIHHRGHRGHREKQMSLGKRKNGSGHFFNTASAVSSLCAL
jgi:hypothetical protein